jgi:aminomethyltransferase
MRCGARRAVRRQPHGARRAGRVGRHRRARHVLVSRVHDLEVGRSRYTMLCDDDGGVIDDVIVYAPRGPVTSSSRTRSTPMRCSRSCAARRGRTTCGSCTWTGHVLLALQGPAAPTCSRKRPLTDRAAGASTRRSSEPSGRSRRRVAGVDDLVARTGYTGEDGFELACDDGGGRRVWAALLAAGAPLGLCPAAWPRGTRSASRQGCRCTVMSSARTSARSRPGSDASCTSTRARASAAVPRSSGSRLRDRHAGSSGWSRRAVAHPEPATRARRRPSIGTITSGAPSPTLGRADRPRRGPCGQSPSLGLRCCGRPARHARPGSGRRPTLRPALSRPT